MYYVGIDVSKNSFTFCIINEKAQILSQRTFPYSPEGFRDFLSILHTLNPVTIVMESSNRYHIPLRVIFAMLRKGETFKPELVAPSTRGIKHISVEGVCHV